MLFFGNPTSSKQVHDAMSTGALGFIDTPMQGNIRPSGVAWCADNGCFGKSFDEDKWWAWLTANAVDAARCVFAVAPDVVGDAKATLERSTPWLPKIRALGYPAAFVSQDGATAANGLIPWGDFDVLFIGGTDSHKLGDDARRIVAHAKHLGLHVHMGRVNGARRFHYAAAIGCDSVDGTYLTFGPDVNLPAVLAWTRQVNLGIRHDPFPLEDILESA